MDLPFEIQVQVMESVNHHGEWQVFCLLEVDIRQHDMIAWQARPVTAVLILKSLRR